MKRENLTETSWLDIGIVPGISENHFNTLWPLHPEEHAEVMIYGKLTPIPRYQRSYGRDYKFSGVVSKGYPIPPEIQPYLDWVNSLGYGEFNEILLNWYEDGSHYIGAHSDDESQLVPGSPIVTLTLCLPGEPRKFRIRDRNKKIVKDILTTNGMALVMGGDFQKQFKHEIVKMTGNAAKKAGARISITFRQFVL